LNYRKAGANSHRQNVEGWGSMTDAVGLVNENFKYNVDQGTFYDAKRNV